MFQILHPYRIYFYALSNLCFKKCLLWVFLGCINLYAQDYNLSGKVISEATKEPLAFATIIVNDDYSQGTITDISGNFTYTSVDPIETLSISYVGYKTQKIEVSEGDLIIKMFPESNRLKEVFLYSENPAHRIIKEAVHRKEENTPENLFAFKYKTYNKTIYDIRGDSIVKEKEKLGNENSYFLIMESVIERKYKKPNLNEEQVIASKVSGFKELALAVQASDLQPFSFYHDNLKLIDRHFLNPISKGSINKYDFKLEEVIEKEQDTVFIISFLPLPNKNFSGLRGFLHINSDNYAVEKVNATPYKKGVVDLLIQQQYEKVDGGFWFPNELKFELYISDYLSKDQNLIVEGASYIYDVEINPSITKRDFSLMNFSFSEDAIKKDSLFWENHRVHELTADEVATYQLIDSIGEKYKFDAFMGVSKDLINNKVPIGPLHLDLSKVSTYNKFEGFRLGLGLYTNDRISDKFILGAFFGYGLRDDLWKYGGSIEYRISKNKLSPSFQISYEHDLEETGRSKVNASHRNLLNFRPLIATRFDRVDKYNFISTFRGIRYLTGTLSFETARREPLYEFTSMASDLSNLSYKISYFSLRLRYAYAEQVKEVFGQLFPEPSSYPVFSLYLEKGIKGMVGSDFSYFKTEASIEQNFYTKNLGRTRYRMEVGYINRNLPYGMLFTGEGSHDTDFPFIMPYTFHTMYPYEFLSNRYMHLFFNHSFEGLLFKKGNFHPDIVIHHNIGLGSLSSSYKEEYSLSSFRTKEKVYLETGVEIQNLLKIKYFNMLNLGFGVGVFYRYGDYSYPKFHENIMPKVTFNLSIN